MRWSGMVSWCGLGWRDQAELASLVRNGLAWPGLARDLLVCGGLGKHGWV